MSRINELVEQIAFGVGADKPAPCLGLYLSPEMVYLSETHLSAGRLCVDHLLRIPIPPSAGQSGVTATMNTGFLDDPSKVAALIRESMSRVRWGSKNVRVTLSHHLGLLRYFPMPAIERRFLASAVPLEAKKHIPIPFDALAYDYTAVPLPPEVGGQRRIGILMAVTQKKNVIGVQQVLASLGLSLAGIEVAPCSLLRLWQTVDAQKSETCARVHIDGANVRIMIVRHGVPVFFREIFLAQDVGAADLRKIDLRGCLSYVEQKLDLGTSSDLRLSGSPIEAALAEALSQETGLKTSVQDLPKSLSIKNADWGGYASIGAAVLAPSRDVAPLDLAISDRVTDEDRRTARAILIVGLAAAVLFSGLGFLKSMTYSYHARELRRYQKALDPQVALALNGMAAPDIDAMIRDMQLQLTQLQLVAAGGARPQISTLLKEVVASMPPNLWFERLSITDDPTSAGGLMDIQLRGGVQGDSVADEQAVAFKFKEDLIKNSLLGKKFDITISVQETSEKNVSQPMPAGAVLAKGPTENLQARTQFELELRLKS